MMCSMVDRIERLQYTVQGLGAANMELGLTEIGSDVQYRSRDSKYGIGAK